MGVCYEKSWTVTHIRRVMSDLTFDVAGDDLVVPSVRGWFEEYISGLSRRGKAMATVRNYRNARERFLLFRRAGRLADGSYYS